MELKRLFIRSLVLRLGLMLGTLGATQITYWQFTESTFVLFNALVFIVGLHTALTYHSQVAIWETGGLDRSNVVHALIMTAVILFGLLFIIPMRVFGFIGAYVYIIYRFADRVTFNTLITQGKVAHAYGIAIGLISVEILTFLLLSATSLNEIAARFLVPSLIAGGLAIWSYRCLRAPVAAPTVRVATSAERNRFAFSLHSLAILCVIMSDRVASSINTDLVFLDARYLLLFSYCGAVYSLGVASLEPARSRYYLTAKNVDSVYIYFAKCDGKLVIFSSTGVALISLLAPFFLSLSIGFENPTNLSLAMQGVYIAGFLLSFFALFFLLAYVQMYYLSRRQFFVVFISWGAALAARAAALAFPRLDAYLMLSVLSAVVAIAILILADSKYIREEPWSS